MTTAIILQACADEFGLTSDLLPSSKTRLPMDIYFDMCLKFRTDLDCKLLDCAVHVDRDLNTLYTRVRKLKIAKQSDDNLKERIKKIELIILNSFS